MPFSLVCVLRPVYGDKCFTRLAIRFGVKFAHGRQSVVDEERFVWSKTKNVWSPFCFADRRNDHSSRFFHTV